MCTIPDCPTPYGYCHCGCGTQTPLHTENDASKGWVRGKPRLYMPGHWGRRHTGPDYLEEDRGYATLCWIWHRSIKNGYGVLLRNGKTVRAHRFYYEQAGGLIPHGTEPDHLCKQKDCVRPDHIEVVTHTINVRRGSHTVLTEEDVRSIFLSRVFSCSTCRSRFTSAGSSDP